MINYKQADVQYRHPYFLSVVGDGDTTTKALHQWLIKCAPSITKFSKINIHHSSGKMKLPEKIMKEKRYKSATKIEK